MLRPTHINESHWNEWVIDSNVDPELTSLNVVSLSGFEPYERLLYALPDSERRNDGRLRDKWLTGLKQQGKRKKNEAVICC